jgi:hypothetical protein
VEILANTLEYLKEYRSDDGFGSALIDSKEIASNLDVEPTFCKENSIRSRRKKTQFDYVSISIAFWMQYYNQYRGHIIGMNKNSDKNRMICWVTC